MMQRKHVKPRNYSGTLTIIHDELWNCHWDGITVYDQELEQMRSMRCPGGNSWVFSVVSLPDDTVAVAGLEHMYQIPRSGCNIYTFKL